MKYISSGLPHSASPCMRRDVLTAAFPRTRKLGRFDETPGTFGALVRGKRVLIVDEVEYAYYTLLLLFMIHNVIIMSITTIIIVIIVDEVDDTRATLQYAVEELKRT